MDHQEFIKKYRDLNFTFMWVAIIISWIMFFCGAPFHLYAVAAGLFFMAGVLILSAFVEEPSTEKPLHSPDVKWDPKKKNDNVKPK